MAFNFVPALLLLLLAQSLTAQQPAQSCTFDPAEDFNATAFYLETNATRFLYPDASGSLVVGPDGAGMRIVCPGGMIEASGEVTEFNAAVVECVGGTTVKLSGSYLYRPLNLFGCSVQPEPVVQVSTRTTTTGKKIAEIGYSMGLIDFLPVVEELSISSFKGGYVSRWAHTKALPIKVDSSAIKEGALVPGELAAKIPYADIYNAAKQKAAFLEVFNDTALVDKYLKNGAEDFVASQLVSAVDLFYEVQRTGARFYENTVPVWRSVAEGNWKQTGEAVRQIAAEALSGDVDVWSGTYLTLYLPGADNHTTYVELPHGLKPAQFLFRYVHDRPNSRGLVFVTVNNPHLSEPNEKNVICEPLPTCATQFPQFADLTKGYTYCCSLKDFQSQAEKLGIPVFDDEPISFGSSRR